MEVRPSGEVVTHRSDNNEYYLHDDALICKNELPFEVASPVKGPTQVGLIGRMFNVSRFPGRRD